ncbi:hypothetical protein K443DRAFT_681092 [Laccaria amethystina LaAM-08-1]|uniref:Uncharacterized protein n=1 Tax=Laccaria amethystina LaAM-08-1 TaxID=1095629 RepID=A0A0C9X9I1_9AGAR|nr:hypothetical protein K443DRAFT_681092 [Laccaria amethystina LaAM-08-1]
MPIFELNERRRRTQSGTHYFSWLGKISPFHAPQDRFRHGNTKLIELVEKAAIFTPPLV